uniref:AlNc14C158G7700 protein n=1 Tax=Albugo laibachii Nc14 TaxID=890382 RepID=F0WML0_9STRA|nr:AlNc14C158G7700 [Albugo laibachii Nc14]|eukprot:CCA22542.1 AlNc14C158G7700 [Albugo laibachii Nc14]
MEFSLSSNENTSANLLTRLIIEAISAMIKVELCLSTDKPKNGWENVKFDERERWERRNKRESVPNQNGPNPGERSVHDAVSTRMRHC